MLPWQQHSRCYSVSFVMYISGAKFEEHCSNISGDILDSVFYYSSGANYDVITVLICIMHKRQYLSKRKTPFVLTLKSLSNKQQVFLLHRHLNNSVHIIYFN